MTKKELKRLQESFERNEKQAKCIWRKKSKSHGRKWPVKF